MMEGMAFIASPLTRRLECRPRSFRTRRPCWKAVCTHRASGPDNLPFCRRKRPKSGSSSRRCRMGSRTDRTRETTTSKSCDSRACSPASRPHSRCERSHPKESTPRPRRHQELRCTALVIRQCRSPCRDELERADLRLRTADARRNPAWGRLAGFARPDGDQARHRGTR